MTTASCRFCGTALGAGARFCAHCGGATSGTLTPSGGGSSAAPAAASGALPAGTLLHGRYRIVRVLGAGAFGRVYQADDEQDPGGAPLAIKELLDAGFATALDKQEAIGWFKREVSTLLTLEHSGIPQIYGYWTARQTAGPFYLAMEYIPGQNLDLVLQEAGGIPWPLVVAWGAALCEVLAYLHSRTPPIVFRDMKLSNVMLDSRTDAPVLVDFGITRQWAVGGGTAIGTWGYTPYEQALGNAEPRSDIYALGATLHALLTGHRPDAEYTRLQRGGLNVEATMRALFPPADSLAPDVPQALAQAITRATAFTTADRFPDAQAFARALVATRPPLFGSVTAPPPRAPNPTLVVALDGSGTHRGLAEAVQAAAPNTTITLGAGIHRLGAELVVRQGLTLVGAGMDATEVVAEQGTCAVRHEGSGLFGLADLTVRWAGTTGASAAVVTGGQVKIARCRFTGATIDPQVPSAGLLLVGDVQGHVTECLIEHNDTDGVRMWDQARPTLEANTCRHNATDGLSVADQARPILEGNTCEHNGRSGIYYADSSQGTARRNTCGSNVTQGIHVGDQAQPTLEANTCEHNQGAGIAYFENTAGASRQNTCSGNMLCGIYMADQARPTLEANTCERNQDMGIAYYNSAAGVARRNTCRDNATDGIYVGWQARPTLDANTCELNQRSGIVYVDSGQGAARENICRRNGQYGIAVDHMANPALRDNLCHGNTLGEVDDRRGRWFA